MESLILETIFMFKQVKEGAMRTIDEEIKFHLTRSGWYLDKTSIEISKETIGGVDVITTYLDAGKLASLMNGKIYISKALAFYASLPQRRLAILHEYAHLKLNLLGGPSHEAEYACDIWALKEMVSSGMYNVRELYNSIDLFVDVINELETSTHPSSKSRYKRLVCYLKENVWLLRMFVMQSRDQYLVQL